ncbi:MAG: glycosyltransferase [bacterium]|nr:glycosyltransferase [bacterium]
MSKLVSAAKIALVQTHLPGANMWGLLLAMRRLCAVVATVHNNQEFRYTSSDSAIKVYLRKNVYRSILRRCNAVIAVSDSVKKSLQDELGVGAHLAAKIVVVPNGVPIPEPLMVVLRRLHSAQMGYAARAVTCLWELGDWKNRRISATSSPPPPS